MTRNNLGAIRKRRGVSQALLAKNLNTSKDQIYKLEHGKRTMSEKWIEGFCKELSCTPNQLLGYEDIDSEGTTGPDIDQDLFVLCGTVIQDLMDEGVADLNREAFWNEVVGLYREALKLKSIGESATATSLMAKWVKRNS